MTQIKSAPFTIEVPKKSPITDTSSGLVSKPWEHFFRNIRRIIDPLSYEKTEVITNNQTSPLGINGLTFDSTKVSQAIVDYLIQRVTTGISTVELIESGTLYAYYKPISNIWSLNTPSTVSTANTDLIDDGAIIFSATTTPPVAGTTTVNQVKHRRYGQFARIEWRINQIAAGTVGSGTYLLPMPAGLVIDTTKTTASIVISDLGAPVATRVGDIIIGSGASASPGGAFVYDANNVWCYFVTGGVAGAWGSGVFAMNNTTLAATIIIDVPILGWSSSDVAPSISGVTFSITPDGSIQYTSSNVAGTPSISKIVFRARTLAGKNSQYSVVGS